MFHRKWSSGLRALIGCACAAALVLTGCSSGGANGDPQPGADSSSTASDQPRNDSSGTKTSSSQPSATSAIVSVDGRTFEFDLRTCSVYHDGEVLLAGPGREVGTQVPSHLDGDVSRFGDDTHGEFRIDIGADGPFQSKDVFISLGNSLGGRYSLSEAGDGYLVTASAWDHNGTDLGTAQLRFTCD